MDAQTAYRHAMRCYRIASKHAGGNGSVAAFTAATSLVRSITGVWDVPRQPPFQTWVRAGKPTKVLVNSINFAVLPRFKHRDDGFGRPLEPVIYRPGKLHVWRSMTEFCKRTRAAS